MSSEEVHNLHILFFPAMTHGHMIPMLDMAKLFESRGVKSTIITTSLNSHFFENAIKTFKNMNPGHEIGIEILDFPPKNSNSDQDLVNSGFESILATRALKEPLEKLIEAIRPDCLVAGMFFPWATDAAARFGVPRVVFHGSSYFQSSVVSCVLRHRTHKKAASSSEPFVIPDLPGNIVMTAEQFVFPDDETEVGKYCKEFWDSEKNSFGVLTNSFYELEPAYADFYQNVLGRRSWHIGPLFLCNRAIEEKAERGGKATVDMVECLKWLDSKEPKSVIYVSFGSMARFTNAQLVEIAAGLEASGQDFIWVVRKDDNKGEKVEWLPEGFEEKAKGKGLIIHGWAPQVVILEHQAIGGFVTHCGWNSFLEGVTSGLPMVTWPVWADQFCNEKLATQVLKTGVSVGASKWVNLEGDFVTREKVEKAVKELMVGEEAEERRRRTKELAVMAKAAVEKGGSSYNGLNRFLEELRLVRTKKD